MANPPRPRPMTRLAPYTGAHRYLTYAAVVLSAVSAALALAPFVFLWLMVREALDVVPDFSRATHLVEYGWGALGAAATSILVYLAALMLSHAAAFRVARNLRVTLMRHLVSLPLGRIDHLGTGKVRSIVNESTGATENYLAHQLPDRAGALVTPVGILVLLFVFDWRLGLASLVPVALAFVILARMTGPRMAQRLTEYRNALADMNNEAVEYVRGIPVVKTFGQTVHSFGRFRESIERYKTWVIAYTVSLRTPMMGFTLGINSAFAFLIAVTLAVTLGQGAPASFVGDLLFYVFFTPLVAVTLTRIMYTSENGLIVHDAMDRIDGLLALRPLAEPASPQVPRGGGVVLENVSFTYPGADKPALTGVSLRLEPGQTCALVGPSGGGKTTLASLVARFWDVDLGSVTVGGVDVRNVATPVLMDSVAFVFQNSRLLKMSLLENVRLGRPGATRDQVLEALSLAQCDDILARVPGGVDAVYGSQGTYLSGGECQRIAIARAILKDAPVVILDEATAFADPENEHLVLKAFEGLSRGKTVLMIAHRLTTVQGADTICVLDGGRIVERGSHGALVAQGGVYAGLWNEYQTAIDWKVGGTNA